MQNNDQKGSLSDKFRDFGAAPSDGLWSAIEQQLEEKKKKRLPFWWWTTGLAACLITGIAILYRNTDTPHEIAANEVNSGTKPAWKQKSASPQAVTLPPTQVTTSQFAPLIPKITYWPGSGTSFAPGGSNNPTPTFSTHFSPLLSGFDTDNNPVDSTNRMPKGDSVNYHDTSLSSMIAVTTTPPDKTGRTSRTWTIGGSLGFSEGIGSDAPVPVIPVDEELDVSIMAPPITSNPTENKTLRQQWSAEILVSCQISKRFSIQSGIEGSMYSTGRVQGTSASTSGKTTGMSVGVPLYLNYSLINYKRLEWFVGTGIQHNFAFSKTLQTTTVYPNSAITTSETINPRGNLTSGQFHTGIRYRFYRSACLEIKPLVRYYFSEQLGNSESFLGKYCWIGGTAGVVWRF